MDCAGRLRNQPVTSNSLQFTRQEQYRARVLVWRRRYMSTGQVSRFFESSFSSRLYCPEGLLVDVFEGIWEGAKRFFAAVKVEILQSLDVTISVLKSNAGMLFSLVVDLNGNRRLSFPPQFPHIAKELLECLKANCR
jgi:hypothetical protein